VDEMMKNESLPEPWLRGTWTEVPAVGRGVLHALELADEDVKKWCAPLTDEELNARPFGLPSVGFQLRHIARSLHRLLTYAEGEQVSDAQMTALSTEQNPDVTQKVVFAEYIASLEATSRRVRGLARLDPATLRTVGRKALPTTVGGLLVHLADHTQRHVGQAVTTAKLVVAMRDDAK
jgi:uncharacterized damage-inducible protein DinB